MLDLRPFGPILRRTQRVATLSGMLCIWMMGCSSSLEPPSSTAHRVQPPQTSGPDPACSGNRNLVQIADGRICGQKTTGGFPGTTANTVWAFRGIPYAASTAGANRFKLAQSPARWHKNTRNATKFGPPCHQLIADPQTGQRTLLGSDDCLSVNVFTPVAPPKTLGSVPTKVRPVMVFLHGGAFVSGAGGSPLYDGSNLAGGGDVVVVTLNYRLGVFGFLGGIDSGDVKNGNLGLKDQQRALRWVRDNIQYFGGDKSKVTLFGESAGASSVGIHLANAESSQLVHQGILQSNHYGMMLPTPKSARHRTRKLLKALHCKGSASQQLACLQREADKDPLKFLETASPKPSNRLNALICNGFGGFEYWAPMMDGHFIKTQPVDSVLTQPVLIGTNTNEGVLFTALSGMYPEINRLAADASLNAIFGLTRGRKVVKAYPSVHKGSQKGVAMAEIFTDYIWNCATNRVLNAAVDAGNEDVYAYHFTHVPSITLYDMGTTDKNKPFPGNPCGPDKTVNPGHTDNVCHGNELPYVFGNPWGFTLASQTQPKVHSFESGEKKMVAQLMKLWTDFAKNGVPSSDFPTFDNSDLPDGEYWILRDTSEGGFGSTTSIFEDSQCSFWQEKVKYELTRSQKKCTGS